MKIQLKGSYTKRVTVKDALGQPVLNEVGREKTEPRDFFRYAVVKATDKEKAEIKEMQAQSGTDYYKEEDGFPILTVGQFYGMEAEGLIYRRETTNQLSFTVDQTEMNVMKAVAGQFESQRSGLEAQMAAKLLSGKKLVTSTFHEEEEEEEEEEELSAEELAAKAKAEADKKKADAKKAKEKAKAGAETGAGAGKDDDDLEE